MKGTYPTHNNYIEEVFGFERVKLLKKVLSPEDGYWLELQLLTCIIGENRHPKAFKTLERWFFSLLGSLELDSHDLSLGRTEPFHLVKCTNA